ncbi:XRE family transcriptional regulator [Sinosporangium album]|nr:XRE family transcriptional regulator [Sinosporangium album]
MRDWSMKQLAQKLIEAAGEELRRQLPSKESIKRRICSWEAGEHLPRDPYRILYCRVFGIEEAVLFPSSPHHTTSNPTLSTSDAIGSNLIRQPVQSEPDASRPSTTIMDFDKIGENDDEVQRREFVGLAGAALFGAVLNEPEKTQDAGRDIDNLAVALVEYSAPPVPPVSLDIVAGLVAQAKQNYQACRYAEVTAKLPNLLRAIRSACTVLGGDAKLRALALSAESHHVTASILLKQEDKGLAWVAADRSVQAAHATESPLVIGSSSRIVVRTLMRDAHHRVAATTASATAARMNADLKSPTADELSIYGSLLLSGAVAAAHTGNRHVVAELIDEADQAAQQLGYDGNHQWTAFGPSNVLCHRVNIAVKLGDAGSAIDYARRIDLDKLPVNERKAALMLDTSRAFLMCGRQDKALHVLRAIQQIASEEVTKRPAALRLIQDIVTTAPSSVRRDAREFAAFLGVIT